MEMLLGLSTSALSSHTADTQRQREVARSEECISRKPCGWRALSVPAVASLVWGWGWLFLIALTVDVSFQESYDL